MRRISLIAGLIAMTVGFGAVSTASSAFAMGCLNPDAGTIDLTHDAMHAGAGWGFDMDGYDAQMAKGNKCSTTQQSTPVSATGEQITTTKHKAEPTYN